MTQDQSRSGIFSAFGDFSGGFSGIGPQNNPSTNFSYVIDGIKSVHAKGGKVKMAYGGAMYDMSGHIHSKYGQIIFTQCQNNP